MKNCNITRSCCTHNQVAAAALTCNARLYCKCMQQHAFARGCDAGAGVEQLQRACEGCDGVAVQVRWWIVTVLQCKQLSQSCTANNTRQFTVLQCNCNNTAPQTTHVNSKQEALDLLIIFAPVMTQEEGRMVGEERGMVPCMTMTSPGVKEDRAT